MAVAIRERQTWPQRILSDPILSTSFFQFLYSIKPSSKARTTQQTPSQVGGKLARARLTATAGVGGFGVAILLKLSSQRSRRGHCQPLACRYQPSSVAL